MATPLAKLPTKSKGFSFQWEDGRAWSGHSAATVTKTWKIRVYVNLQGGLRGGLATLAPRRAPLRILSSTPPPKSRCEYGPVRMKKRTRPEGGSRRRNRNNYKLLRSCPNARDRIPGFTKTGFAARVATKMASPLPSFRSPSLGQGKSGMAPQWSPFSETEAKNLVWDPQGREEKRQPKPVGSFMDRHPDTRK